MKRYQVTVSGGSGVFYLDGVTADRVKHELRTLPDDWTIHIWDMTDKEHPIKCTVANFAEAVTA